jgi:hypothetical protein
VSDLIIRKEEEGGERKKNTFGNKPVIKFD